MEKDNVLHSKLQKLSLNELLSLLSENILSEHKSDYLIKIKKNQIK